MKKWWNAYGLGILIGGSAIILTIVMAVFTFWLLFVTYP